MFITDDGCDGSSCARKFALCRRVNVLRLLDKLEAKWAIRLFCLASTILFDV